MKQVNSNNLAVALDVLPVSPHQFRIFKRKGMRRAFRLERVFWTVLERAARHQMRRIGDLVFDIVSQSAGADNFSSALRCYAIVWLDEQARIADAKIITESALAVFNVSPAAGLILDEHRFIISYNAALLEFMQQKMNFHSTEIGEARLSFDLTMTQILEIVGDSNEKVVECGFRFMLNGISITGRTRVSRIITPPQELQRLLAFIL